MSADEIRRLVRIYNAKEKNLKDQLDKFKGAEMLPNLENISIARKDAIMTIKALLAYAAMVERCEEVINGKFDGEMRDVWGVGDVYTSDTVMAMQNYILKGANDGTKH